MTSRPRGEEATVPETEPPAIAAIAAIAATPATPAIPTLPANLPANLAPTPTTPDTTATATATATAINQTVDAVVAKHVKNIYLTCNGNARQAAQILGIGRSTLYRMLNTRLGVTKQQVPARHSEPQPLKTKPIQQ
jgi:DNA-binding NtrC family response regulator